MLQLNYKSLWIFDTGGLTEWIHTWFKETGNRLDPALLGLVWHRWRNPNAVSFCTRFSLYTNCLEKPWVHISYCMLFQATKVKIIAVAFLQLSCGSSEQCEMFAVMSMSRNALKHQSSVMWQIDFSVFVDHFRGFILKCYMSNFGRSFSLHLFPILGWYTRLHVYKYFSQELIIDSLRYIQ